jgi:hypothetical protein
VNASRLTHEHRGIVLVALFAAAWGGRAWEESLALLAVFEMEKLVESRLPISDIIAPILYNGYVVRIVRSMAVDLILCWTAFGGYYIYPKTRNVLS